MKWLNVSALALAGVAAALLFLKNYRGHETLDLLNVSYDPTREVYQEIDPKFVAQFAHQTGRVIHVEQSHGGSSSQARAVAGGLAADVVTLALPSDISSLQRAGLVAEDWQKRFPHRAQPYYSTIVFVVRKDNPKNIRDWPDLAARGVEIVTPNPQTSGNGKLSFLAAWGSVIARGGSDDAARRFVTQLYRNVTTLGAGARDSTTTFELEKVGDVQLTWENEAIREVAESKGELEIVYPSISIRAEPSVAVVDVNTAKHHSELAARSYLSYLFSDEIQEIFAADGYRPSNGAILREHQKVLPKIALFPITRFARDWSDAQEKFFGDSGIFNVIHAAKST